MTMHQKIAEIEIEMARTQKNKATEHHLGLLKARLAKLKSQIIDDKAKASKGGGGEGFDVAKTGDCRVCMIGFPSVGKSTLMQEMTDVKSEVAAYEFTTLTCIPGEYEHCGTTIQLLDLPGIIEGAKDGKGRGKQVIGVARTCNLILLVLDALKPLTDKKKIEYELEGFGIRLNKSPPKLMVKKKAKGGIGIMRGAYDNPDLPDDMIKSILAEYKNHNCDVIIGEHNLTVDDLIDVVEGNRKYISCVYVLNKCDALSLEELDLLGKSKNVCPIAARVQWNLDGLKDMIWNKLDLLRV